ncbi:MAG: N-methyl-D-aspartate receptor NMDAR2C subunit [Spirulina sp.]
MMLTFHRWQNLCNRLGAKTIPSLTPLLDAYREPHRHYHTLQHIEDCLRWCDRIPVKSPVVEAALWFHDIIYHPQASDNERKSADYADRILASAGVEKTYRSRIADCILATRHDVSPTDPLAATVVSIDLAILGSGLERYREYTRAIRLEYHWLSDRQFNAGRIQVLRSLLQRPKIFLIEPLFSQLEELARINIQAELQDLEAIASTAIATSSNDDSRRSRQSVADNRDRDG